METTSMPNLMEWSEEEGVVLGQCAQVSAQLSAL